LQRAEQLKCLAIQHGNCVSDIFIAIALLVIAFVRDVDTPCRGINCEAFWIGRDRNTCNDHILIAIDDIKFLPC